jgi:hypothetical protein
MTKTADAPVKSPRKQTPQGTCLRSDTFKTLQYCN